MISEGHGIMNKTTRESALGIKLKIVEIEEFGGFSQTNVKDLVEYLKEIRNLSEVSYLYIVHFVFKFQRSFEFCEHLQKYLIEFKRTIYDEVSSNLEIRKTNTV